MADRDDKFRWGQRENTRSNSPSRQIEKPTLALSRGPENPTLDYNNNRERERVGERERERERES